MSEASAPAAEMVEAADAIPTPDQPPSIPPLTHGGAGNDGMESAAQEGDVAGKVGRLSIEDGGATKVDSTDAPDGAASAEPRVVTASDGALATEPVIRMFVGDLAEHTTEESLTAHFERFGTVVSAVIKHTSPGNERARSFGFVSLIGEDHARAALAATHTIDGKLVGKADVAKNSRVGGELKGGDTERRDGGVGNNGGGSHGGGSGHGGGGSSGGGKWESSPTAASRKIFVGGLSHTTKESGLQSYFSQFGVMVDVVVMMEPNTRRSRGFGFVTFENASSVTSVVSRGRFHPLDGRLVEVKVAIPREAMKQSEGGRGKHGTSGTPKGDDGGGVYPTYPQLEPTGGVAVAPPAEEWLGYGGMGVMPT
jgi:RNA recognition motif-containing protein